METDEETPANPILFWKEVEKRNAERSAVGHEFPGTPPGGNTSSSKLKIELPPPAPSTPEDKIDWGTAVYGAFNFWKTRDVEVVQRNADYKARKRPVVAAPKLPKPTDEALLQKPPLQAVRLRFLQKSKSVETIQTNVHSESPDRRRERIEAYNAKREEEIANSPSSQRENGTDHDNKSDILSDAEDIADPEAVFEVLEEVLEGVLEGDDVTSLVQKAAQKVKFRDEEEPRLYGGIVINDDKEIPEYEEGSGSGSASGDEEDSGEPEDDEGEESDEKEDREDSTEDREDIEDKEDKEDREDREDSEDKEDRVPYEEQKLPEGDEEADKIVLEKQDEQKVPQEDEEKVDEKREEVAVPVKEEPADVKPEPETVKEETKEQKDEIKEEKEEQKNNNGENESDAVVVEKAAEVPSVVVEAPVQVSSPVPEEKQPSPVSAPVSPIKQEQSASTPPSSVEKPKKEVSFVSPGRPRVDPSPKKPTFVDFEDEIFMKYVSEPEPEPLVSALRPASAAFPSPAPSPVPSPAPPAATAASPVRSPTPTQVPAQAPATTVTSPARTQSQAQLGEVDQIDESITTLNKGDKAPPKKTGSRIIRRAGQLSKFITLRGDKDGTEKDKDGAISPTKQEQKEQKEREYKEYKEQKARDKEQKEKDKEEKHKEKDKDKEDKHKEKEEKHKEKEEKHKEKEEKHKEKEGKHKEKEERHKEKGEKRKKGSSIFVKRSRGPQITIDTNLHGSGASSPTSPPVSPRNYPEGQTFAVELDYLPFDPATGVPKFLAAAIQILTASEFEDVDYLYFDSETNPKILPLKAQFDTEPLDPTKSYDNVLIAGLLKLFFAELPIPLIPQRLYYNFGADLQEIGEPPYYIGYLRTMVWALPTRHRVVLQVLVKFLREKYLRNPANSKEYVMNKLGAAFGPILLRAEDPTKQPTEVPLSCSICRTIITNYETIFENFEEKDSIYTVRMNTLVLLQATQERIIDRLLDVNYNEPEFAHMFFTIHQIFLTHNGLLDILHGLYINNTQNKGKSPKPWKQAMAFRILEVVKMWIEFSFNEFREDKALLTRVLRDFPPIEQAYKSQQHANAKANSHMSFLSNIGARARSSLSVQNVPILETSTVELAQHLTMVDFDLFCAVKSIEWLKYTEPFSSPDKKFPHLYAFQRQHSLWEYWTATEILREPHVGLRVLRVAHFIKVALICREMNNHCTSLAIIAGLLHPGIRRLDCTWQILAKDMRDIFDNLIEWHKSESEKTIEEIVTALQQTKRPFLPSPITLHRLISLLNASHPLHPTKAPHLFDLDRLRIINAMMRSFQSILNHPYPMKAVPRLYMQLQEVSVLSGDQLMYQSMKCEPPETPPSGGMGAPTNTTPTASAGILISSGGLSSGGYKVPEASNNWKAEVKRIWNKPVEQLPIGIDLPRLANSIFVPSLINADQPPQPRPLPGKEEEKEAKEETTEKPADATEPTPMDTSSSTTPNGDVPVPPATSEPASTTEAAPAAPVSAPAVVPPVADEIDTKAREIMHTLYNMARFIEDDEYAQKLVDNFGSFVILEGAKDRDMTREIARLVAEYLGKESRMVRVLKACNQAIIAPAVIELTLNVCAKVPFKDAGGWRMELTKNEDGLITVTHVKQQRQRSSNKEDEFSFEWHLEIIFDEGLTGLSDVFLSIPKLNFGPHVSQSTMEGIQYTFAPYLVRR